MDAIARSRILSERFDSGFRAGLRRAEEIVQGERVEVCSPEDEAYNLAIEHCAEAILKEANE